MVLVKLVFKGEDLTEGKGTLIDYSSVREIEAQGFVVEIIA